MATTSFVATSSRGCGQESVTPVTPLTGHFQDSRPLVLSQHVTGVSCISVDMECRPSRRSQFSVNALSLP
jgi:hypothetical protein